MKVHGPKQTEVATDRRHTHTHTDYCNPLAHAPRVNNRNTRARVFCAVTLKSRGIAASYHIIMAEKSVQDWRLLKGYFGSTKVLQCKE